MAGTPSSPGVNKALRAISKAGQKEYAMKKAEEKKAKAKANKAAWKKKQPITTQKPASSYMFNHPKYVVSIPMLREYIEANSYKMETKDLYGNDILMVGWKEQFCHRVSGIMRCSLESSKRRLYDVMHNKARVINVEFAEATAVAFGHDLDRDTEIPTLPGNKELALDLIRIRAEEKGEELDELEERRLASRAMRVASLIAKYPHHHRMLCDMAPLDCLRPIQ